MSLESLRLPVAVIVTAAFVREARLQREALGMKDLVPVVIEHPLSSLSDEQIRGRAVQALPQVIAVWNGTQADSSRA